MTISQWAKAVVAIALSITTIIAGVKSGAEIVKNLNGWHVLFFVSLFVLTVLGVDYYRQWIARQFADLKTEIKTGAQKEERDRTAWVQRTQTQYADLDTKVSNIETRLGKLERWIKPPDHA